MTDSKSKTVDTQTKIIEAALDILTTQGHTALTSGSLTNALNISKGTLFHHFQDMDAILLGVLEHLVNEINQQVQGRDHKDLWAFIDANIQITYEALEKYQGVFATLMYFIAQAPHKPDFQSRLRNHMDTELNKWKASFFKHMPTTITEKEKDHIVRMIDMHFGGACIHHFIYNDPKHYREISEEFLDIIASYLDHNKPQKHNSQ
ncbi:transcriptional regulator BetI [Poriferisphaera corsica]|uniref:Transcriptional regulator BetI n=1 Tax=Poriferisphaera corsica TaxID=2528020 RepID=A0A517YZF5_9BACT|nr:TetR/AcrR family transcriptional regulator [Poriferisphaera corsica]QDU35594.1 transcriptional regulator BetI [Poriferisphaera corsica]